MIITIINKIIINNVIQIITKIKFWHFTVWDVRVPSIPTDFCENRLSSFCEILLINKQTQILCSPRLYTPSSIVTLISNVHVYVVVKSFYFSMFQLLLSVLQYAIKSVSLSLKTNITSLVVGNNRYFVKPGFIIFLSYAIYYIVLLPSVYPVIVIFLCYRTRNRQLE